MDECYRCGFWNSDYESCECPSYDKWYACPVESQKPENIKALEEYADYSTYDDFRNSGACKYTDCNECDFRHQGCDEWVE